MSSTDRRTFLQLGAVASALSLTGCDRFWRGVSKFLGAAVPARIAAPDGAEVDPAHHFLSRAGFGPWPGDVERVRDLGTDAYLEEQLAPETVDDAPCEILAQRFESVHMPAQELSEFKKPRAREELTRMTLLRAIYSRRQVYEAMVHFWTDHFNIDMSKSNCAWLKIADDRDVIRKHALGSFRELLHASATSPAMLYYLDGRENRKTAPGGKPNENYGRELMELHSLGVHGGYSQQDVMEVARCLTGWTTRRRPGIFQQGLTVFHPQEHDDGEKVVLGTTIPAGGGEKDLERVIDLVSAHPSTARFLATKLCRRFVADRPPEALVERVAEVFLRTQGDIKQVLATVLRSEEFRRSVGAKLKRPFHFVVSALRALGADTNADDPILDYLERLGHAPFQFPTPDGYPDEATPWLGTMLWRWNFAIAVATNRIPGTRADLRGLAEAVGKDEDGSPILPFQRYLLGRQPTEEEAGAIWKYLGGSEEGPADRRAEAVGLVLASPAYQWC